MSILPHFRAQIPDIQNYRKINSFFGCDQLNLCSLPGVLRVLNGVLGGINFGLWMQGYLCQYECSMVNVYDGYGIGWEKEPLNQLVMCLIVLCWMVSSILLLTICELKKTVNKDWDRINKLIHLTLAVLQLSASVLAMCGILYFNQNCCHANMDWVGFGVLFSVTNEDGYYQRHCDCYLTRYWQNGTNHTFVAKTELINAAWGEPTGWKLLAPGQSWTFAAHHLVPHITAVFTILGNGVIYLLVYKYSKPRKE